MAPSTNSRSPTPNRSGDAAVRLAAPTLTRSEDTESRAAASSSPQSHQRVECPDCGGTDRVTDDGVQYCDDCGVVLDDRRIERSEPSWREPAERRLGPQQSQQWVNTGTSIDYGSAGDAGRFAEYNERLTNRERSLVRGLREVRSLSAGVELPEPMRERAAYLYRAAARDDLLTGRSIDGIAAACVYVAAREQRQPITIDYLAEFSPLAASKIRLHVQVVKSELSVSVPPAHPRDFLPLIASRLDLGPAVERRATEALERVTAAELHVGKHPAAIAATVVYAVANDAGSDLTQATVATAADVSTVTISRRHQEIREILPA